MAAGGVSFVILFTFSIDTRCMHPFFLQFAQTGSSLNIGYHN